MGGPRRGRHRRNHDRRDDVGRRTRRRRGAPILHRARDAGLARAKPADLLGGEAETNARAINDLLSGETGPFRDIVILNASAALIVAGKVRSLAEGVARSAEAIDGGRGTRKVETARPLEQPRRRRMSDILAQICAGKREEVSRRRKARPLNGLIAAAARPGQFAVSPPPWPARWPGRAGH